MPASTARARRAALSADDPDVLARFFHGLADPTRVQILLFLLDGPKTALTAFDLVTLLINGTRGFPEG